MQVFNKSLSKMTDHYVYVHKRLSDGTVFYVGQGRGRRSVSKSGRNAHWHRTVSKHGYTVLKIAENLHPQCALSIERALINHYGRENLVNLTDGGDVGPTGLVHSTHVREAQSLRMLGNSHTRGKPLTEEHKEKIRAYRPTPEQIEKRAAKIRGRPQTDSHKARISKALKGRVFTTEWRDKISTSLRGRFSGKDNPKYDPTKHTLLHADLGIVSATRLEFSEKYGIPSTKFSALMCGRRKSHKGWRLPC